MDRAIDRPSLAHEDRSLDTELIEELRQRDECLVMHVPLVAWRRQRVGVAIAVARIDDHVAARRMREPAGEVAPQGNRAQPFVQQHQRRKFRRRDVDPLVFDPMAGDRQEHFVRPRDAGAAGPAAQAASHWILRTRRVPDGDQMGRRCRDRRVVLVDDQRRDAVPANLADDAPDFARSSARVADRRQRSAGLGWSSAHGRSSDLLLAAGA